MRQCGSTFDPVPHEFRSDGIRLIAMPPCDSSFCITPDRPLLAVTTAEMTCRLAIAGDRLERRHLPPFTVGLLPAGAELRMAGESPAWSLLLEIDTKVHGLRDADAIERPLDFEVDQRCGNTAVEVLSKLVAPFPDRLEIETLGFEIASQALLRAGSSSPQLEPAGSNDARVQRIKDRIRADLQDVPGIVALAADCRVSPTHLSRLFRNATGFSIWEFVVRERCTLARAMLMSCDEPIAEVAYACGFHDQAHMTHALRQTFGVTPKVLRAERGRIIQ
ncbi:MAG: AraC family transcriptional regulator [Pseudomonadota bacterium]